MVLDSCETFDRNGRIVNWMLRSHPTGYNRSLIDRKKSLFGYRAIERKAFAHFSRLLYNARGDQGPGTE